MNLTQLFTQISHQMNAELEAARFAASHPGVKGTAFENIVKHFLTCHIPDRLGICTGQLVDSTGAMSKQLDIIIYDKAHTPVLFQSEGIQVIPNECAYAVIEVKAKLEASIFPAIFANMLSVKDLKKTAYYQAGSGLVKYYTVHGKRWAYWPTSYFVFAFESANPNSMMIPLIEHHNATSGLPEKKIDLICLLDKGVFVNMYTKDNSITSLPEPDTIQMFKPAEHTLLLFYSMLSHLLSQYEMPPFRFLDYVNGVKW